MADAPRSGRSDRSSPNLVDLLQIGAVAGISIGVGLFLGYLLDRVAGTSPLLTFLGLAFGIVMAAVGAHHVIRPYLANASTEASKTKE